MPDPITSPSLPTAPPPVSNPTLTVAMKAADAESGGSPPGAGGWVPSMATVYLIGAIGTTFGAAVPVIQAALPTVLGTALAGLCGAVAAGCVFFAMKSAGPRKYQQ